MCRVKPRKKCIAGLTNRGKMRMRPQYRANAIRGVRVSRDVGRDCGTIEQDVLQLKIFELRTESSKKEKKRKRKIKKWEDVYSGKLIATIVCAMTVD